MIVFVLEDEPFILKKEKETIQQTLPQAQVYGFSLAKDALAAIEDKHIFPHVVFTDIEMPGMGGLAFSMRLKALCPDAKIIFVTAYPQYATDAYRMHINGYVMKPLTAARVQEEMEALSLPFKAGEGKIQVHCFGSFEVFWKDQPLLFDRRQTKELLAFLIDREGKMCTAEEIIAAFWEEEIDLRAAKARLRSLINDLRRTLEGIGMKDALIRKSGLMAIRREMVDCDYYRMLQGDAAAINAYRGEYMKQYSWAEPTAASLHFRDYGKNKL